MAELEDLMARVREGSSEALEELVATFRVHLVSAATRILGDHSGAEDVAQETLLRIWLRRQEYDPTRPAWPWIVTLLRNQCHDYWRRHASRKRDTASEDPNVTLAGYVHAGGSTPQEAMEREELMGLARRRIWALPPVLREVVQLFFFERMTESEIAGLLNIPIGTVKSRKHRALKRLAALLDDIQEGLENGTP